MENLLIVFFLWIFLVIIFVFYNAFHEAIFPALYETKRYFHGFFVYIGGFPKYSICNFWGQMCGLQTFSHDAISTNEATNKQTREMYIF